MVRRCRTAAKVQAGETRADGGSAYLSAADRVCRGTALACSIQVFHRRAPLEHAAPCLSFPLGQHSRSAIPICVHMMCLSVSVLTLQHLQLGIKSPEQPSSDKLLSIQSFRLPVLLQQCPRVASGCVGPQKDEQSGARLTSSGTVAMSLMPTDVTAPTKCCFFPNID